MMYRHKIQEFKIYKPELIEHHKNRIQKSILRLKNNQPINLFSVKDRPLAIATYAAMKDLPSIMSQNIKSNLEFGIAHFERVISKTEQTEITIAGQKFIIENIRDNHGAKSFNWFELFSMALLLDNNFYINKLLKLGEEILNGVDDPFWKLAVRFLLAISDRNTEQINKLLIQLSSSANSGIGLHIGLIETKEVFIETRAEKMTTFYLPLFELYQSAFLKEEEKFNSVLEEYLMNKKKYIIKYSWEDDSRYWVDFHCLGVCAYANDQGVNIKVASEYIPEWVFKRDFN